MSQGEKEEGGVARARGKRKASANAAFFKRALGAALGGGGGRKGRKERKRRSTVTLLFEMSALIEEKRKNLPT